MLAHEQCLCKSASRYASGLLASTRGYAAPLPSREAALVAAPASGLKVDRVALMGGDKKETVDVATASFIFNSQCEHHMLPFYGRVMVAYITPAGSAQLLSKSALEQVRHRHSISRLISVDLPYRYSQFLRGDIAISSGEHRVRTAVPRLCHRCTPLHRSPTPLSLLLIRCRTASPLLPGGGRLHAEAAGAGAHHTPAG